MATVGETETQLRSTGSEIVKTVDHIERHADVIAKVGREIVDSWLDLGRAHAAATTAGDLRRTHSSACKPTNQTVWRERWTKSRLLGLIEVI